MAGRDVTTNNNEDDILSHRLDFWSSPRKQFIYQNIDKLEVFPSLPIEDSCESFTFEVNACESFLDLKNTTFSYLTESV